MLKQFAFTPAKDVQEIVGAIALTVTEFAHVDLKKIICFRSTGSKSRATARIWSLPRIWQEALSVSPHYVIEIISARFDKLSDEDKRRVLIHELMHIPKTFSGSLVPHQCFGKRIDKRSVEKIYSKYKANF
jgi:predicted metallopeptidase